MSTKKYLSEFTKKKFFAFAVFLVFFLLWKYTPNSIFPREKVTNFFAFFFENGRVLKTQFLMNQNSPQEWQTKYEKLSEDFLKLQSDSIGIQNAIEENVELKKLLDYQEEGEGSLLIAKIIGKPPEEFSRSWIINKGAHNGVKVGEAVVGEGNYLIGRIQKVGEYHSVVLLLQDNHFQIAASFIDSSKTIGVAQGSFGLGITLQYIPRTETIELGNMVLSSGIEPEIPRGLIIGEIKEITTRSNDLFQSAVVSQPEEFQYLNFVGILRSQL